MSFLRIRLSENVILGLDPGIQRILICCYTWILAFAELTRRIDLTSKNKFFIVKSLRMITDKYPFSEIETKWQKYLREHRTNSVDLDDTSGKNQYILVILHNSQFSVLKLFDNALILPNHLEISFLFFFGNPSLFQNLV